MNGFELVAGVIAAFFVIGFGFGALLVIALPVMRRRRGALGAVWDGEYRGRRRLPADDGSGRIDWEEVAGPGNDNEARRWPW